MWRVFPWDPHANAGARFSASFVPDPTGRGRFDLPRSLSPVLYLAESPEHAVAEMLQPWRGRRMEAAHLERAGLPLASVSIDFVPGAAPDLLDLCDPVTLVDLGIAPDVTASRLREHTQPVARAVWERGAAGLRWWSSFWGDWHTAVLFTERIAGGLHFGEPEPLSVTTEAVVRAADLLGMHSQRPRPALHGARPR